MTIWRDRRGLSFVSVLVTLLILAALYFGYLRSPSSDGERSVGIQSLDASRAVACRTQRQGIERDLQMYAANNDRPPGSLDELRRSGIGVPDCPEGGRYALAGGRVTCSAHP
jgi:hypothetical protein